MFVDFEDHVLVLLKFRKILGEDKIFTGEDSYDLEKVELIGVVEEDLEEFFFTEKIVVV